ncbi:MAG TPA: hypothetical protein VFT86_01370 [Gaiellaceae bacterium]|nr:hypothetical protein [Gaiellaceae bacterium]
MNAVSTALSSPRFNRILLWASALVLAAGVFVVVAKLAGGSDRSARGPDPNFKPALPAKQVQLKNAQGVPIRKYQQLDPATKSTIRTFLGTAVAREHLDKSWATIAPSMRKGYTYKQWANASALPIVPYLNVDLNTVQYYLDYASTKEILLEVGLSVRPEIKGEARTRPVAFQLGLRPVGKGAQKRWLVSYWMPRWTPPLPIN